MRGWRGAAATTLFAVTTGLAYAPAAHAIDDCGVGMYYNNAAGQCESWVGQGWTNGWGYDPTIPVPVPGIGVGWDPGVEANFFSDIVPSFDIGLPGIGVPNLRGVVPDVRVGDVIPRVGDVVPDVHVGDVVPHVGDVIPDVRVPDVRVPEIHAPAIHGRR